MSSQTLPQRASTPELKQNRMKQMRLMMLHFRKYCQDNMNRR